MKDHPEYQILEFNYQHIKQGETRSECSWRRVLTLWFLERDKLIAKMKLSLCMIATASTTVTAQSAADPYVDEILKSDFYGPILDEMKLADDTVAPIADSCCATLKMWGDIGLFAGRFDQSEHQHNGRPVYRAAAGELKVFFNAQLNRWTVSDEGKAFPRLLH